MTSLLGRAGRGRAPGSPEDLDRRLEALREAADLADGRLESESVDAARAVVQRAGKRLGLGLEATVAALAGPTGAGKSSLFNALAGGELVTASPRRPTTSAATAAVWGEPPERLLDWLAVGRRHVVEGDDLAGLVLLDLPDFDSVEEDHRLEVDRVVGLADLVVWVVDPQKYADASLHDGYLRRLASHAGVMLIALNQADRLGQSEARRVLDDLKRLLGAEGLAAVPALAVSARTGAGVPELREQLRARVARRAAAVERLRADVAAAASSLAAECGPAATAAGVGGEAERRLVLALGEAAGVGAVTAAVERAHRRRGALRAGWPVVRWVRRLRPDPLRRLRLDERPAGADAVPDRTSLPRPTSAQRLQAEAAVRSLAAEAAAGLPGAWPGLVREAGLRRSGELGDRLDRAVAGADLRMQPPRWWRPADWLQRLLAFAALGGAVWLVLLAGLAWLRLDGALPVPEAGGLPLPTVLLAGGLLAGWVIALGARWLNRIGARRRARRARRALDAQIAEAARELVVRPVQEELAAHRALCERLAAAA